MIQKIRKKFYSLSQKLKLRFASKEIDREKSSAGIEIFPDDLFLVSYPKSGNTWLRFLFANILKENSSELITFKNVHDYCPEWNLQDDLIRNLTRPRIMKSHEPFNASFSKVIYIVRDPRDVYISYYQYLKNTLPAEWTFVDFIQHFKYPFGRWTEHVESWIMNKADDPEHFKMIRYEDLKLTPLPIFSELARFAGFTVPEHVLQAAVRNSSFDVMRDIEQRYGRKYNDGAEHFVRSGQTGQWKESFGDVEWEIFGRKEDNYHKWLAYFGYPE